jgi:hypothetical protein
VILKRFSIDPRREPLLELLLDTSINRQGNIQAEKQIYKRQRTEEAITAKLVLDEA